MIDLLSGNQAIARGAYEAGVKVAAGYPGTPSTEILESLAAIDDPEVYREWSPNEKVAFEVAAGASHTGARAMVTMKHVGLNVAADPLMTMAYTGCVGGFVIIVADDPGMHSSQNEQDSRHYARFSKLPMLEPSDSQEAKDMVMQAFELSEQYQSPVIIRTTTRVSHSRSLVEIGERAVPDRRIRFEKDPVRFVPLPAHARIMRVQLEERLNKLKAAVNTTELNRIEAGDGKLGIITSSISYQYAREAFPEASILKLGWAYPFADDLIKKFAESVEQLLIVEELDDILEQHVKALGIKCVGREFVPDIGELSTKALDVARAKMEGKEVPDYAPVELAGDLPGRPPTLCPSCPHRGLFYALNQYDCIVTGDIGCYTLGTLPPLSKMDTLLCMGAGVSMAHGMQKAGDERKIVGVVGDSTFYHSGITGLLDIGYNKGASIILVLDNRTTAMTGHQEHPGSGRTLMGEDTIEASIEEIGKACGIKRVFTVDPVDLEGNIKLIGEELETDEPTLIIAKGPCILHEKPTNVVTRTINEDECVVCGNCTDLGCPAIEAIDGYPHINEMVCLGCGLCERVCDTELIQPSSN